MGTIKLVHRLHVDYCILGLENACKSLSWCADDVTGRGDDPEL